MLLLIVGIVVFLGIHLLPTFRSTRQALVERFGENGYKAAFSVASILGFVLLVYGYVKAPYIPVWTPPIWMQHLALLLMLHKRLGALAHDGLIEQRDGYLLVPEIGALARRAQLASGLKARPASGPPARFRSYRSVSNTWPVLGWSVARMSVTLPPRLMSRTNSSVGSKPTAWVAVMGSMSRR